MANVTPDMVRDRLNLTVTDIEDTKVVEIIKDATATIELETGLNIDYTNCSKAEALATVTRMPLNEFRQKVNSLKSKG